MSATVHALMLWMAGIATVSMIVGVVLIIQNHGKTDGPMMFRSNLGEIQVTSEETPDFREFSAGLDDLERAEFEAMVTNICYVVGAWFATVVLIAVTWRVARKVQPPAVPMRP